MTRAEGPGAFLLTRAMGPGAFVTRGALVPLTGQQPAGASHCHVVGRRAKTDHTLHDHGPKAVGRDEGHEEPERCDVAPLAREPPGRRRPAVKAPDNDDKTRT